jgi:activating signal cointegrator complex subunit 3
VVIKSTQMYQGGAKGYAELPKSALLQMMGRAGRPQFDTHGVVAIMVRRRK